MESSRTREREMVQDFFVQSKLGTSTGCFDGLSFGQLSWRCPSRVALKELKLTSQSLGVSGRETWASVPTSRQLNKFDAAASKRLASVIWVQIKPTPSLLSFVDAFAELRDIRVTFSRFEISRQFSYHPACSVTPDSN